LQEQKRKITKKELLSALKKTKKEVEEKQLLLAASQKKCSQLSTKNSLLVEGIIRDARSQARSSKAAPARAEEEARATSIQLDRSTYELLMEVRHLQSTLATKEVEHKQAVGAAVEKEIAMT
jgi:hypothetical protein